MRWGDVRYWLLSAVVAMFLWAVAQGSSSIERSYDIPVVIEGIPENAVITDQNADKVNMRVMGRRSALRGLDPEKLVYMLDVSGAKIGVADYEVDLTQLDLPRGARIVSRSPSAIELKFESRGTKSVRVRADVEGEPASGFRRKSVEVVPDRIRIAGARSEVLRLQEVVTETVDISGIRETTEREVRLSLGSGHLWVDETRQIVVRVEVEPAPEAAAEGGAR
jgi:YbbR domain-containing protein